MGHTDHRLERNVNRQQMQFEKYQAVAQGNASRPLDARTSSNQAYAGSHYQYHKVQGGHNEGSEYSRGSYTSGAHQPVPVVNAAVGGSGMQKAALYKGPKRHGGLVQPRHILESQHL